MAGEGLVRLDEVGGRGLGGVEEDDVGGAAAGCIDGEEDDGAGVDLGHGVGDGAVEEEEVSGGEGGDVFGGLHPEGSGAGEDVEELVAVLVVVGRGGAIDAEDAGAGGGFVGEVVVEEEGGGLVGEAGSDLGWPETGGCGHGGSLVRGAGCIY
jgi:hypothetical protein